MNNYSSEYEMFLFVKALMYLKHINFLSYQ